MKGLIIDNFAGGGGASEGIFMALGRHPDYAINHDFEALAMHAMNHPQTEHLCEDVWEVDPTALAAGRHVSLAWFSPDCKHFSKAKGGKPVEKKIRGLAWVAVKYAKLVRPDVIMLENVEEFKGWGPLLDDGRPDPFKRGFIFRKFVKALELLGYQVEYKELRACDYGAPTTRKRLFLIARCDGQPIVWPESTHGKGRIPHLSAAEHVIDWSLPCPSIFARKKPLAENTQRRIARGIDKFVINDPDPFIVRIGHTGHGDSGKVRSIHEPLSTVTSKAEHLLVAPFFVPRYGEDKNRNGGRGQAPRVLSVQGPLPTIVPTGNGAQLVAAFLAKHNGGNEATGQRLQAPLDTVTAIDTKALVASTLVKLRGTSKHGQDVKEPLHTVTGGGNHFAEVRAFMIKFYSEGGQWARVDEPVHTIPTVARMGLVMVHGEPYQMVDIGMRMLTPRELFRAQGFGEHYIIDPVVDGRTIPERSQTRMCGNSVSPAMARALVSANFAEEAARVAAAA